MDINSLYTSILVQPIYNGLVALYTTVAQQQSGLMVIIVGLLTAAVFIPAMIKGYYDQERTKDLGQIIAKIQQDTPDKEDQQQQIVELLKKKQIRFQSESLFLFGITVIAGLIYPILLNYWTTLQSKLLYDFTPRPDQIDPSFLNISINHSSPTLSLIPAILLFFELRQSYQEQKFLTSFLDRWYPVILPLFVYFLIFWLPSGIPLFLTVVLGFSLYLRFLLNLFTKLKR